MDPLEHGPHGRRWHADSEKISFTRFLIAFALLIAVGGGVYYAARVSSSEAIPYKVMMRLDRNTIELVERAGAEPCNVDVANMLTTRLLGKAEYAAVLSFFRWMENTCALDKDLLAIKLHAQKGSSDFAGAESTATRLIEEAPSSAEAYGWRSEAREGLGNIQGAYDDMKKTYYLLPDPSMASSHVYYKLSHYAAKLGDYCEAANILRDYLTYDQQHRRTQQVETLKKEWMQKGNCPPVQGKGTAHLRYPAGTQAVVMPVTINGISTRMIVDTGASRTLLTKGLAERAGIKPSAGLGAMVATANGVIWQPGGRAKSITLGDATSTNVPVFIQTTDKHTLGEGVEGLLGLSFLGNFQFSMNRGILDLKSLD